MKVYRVSPANERKMYYIERKIGISSSVLLQRVMDLQIEKLSKISQNKTMEELGIYIDDEYGIKKPKTGKIIKFPKTEHKMSKNE